MHAIVDSLSRRTDLTALRTFVAQQRERAGIIRTRDAHRNAAHSTWMQYNPDGTTVAQTHLAEASRLTSQLRPLPRGNRNLRRAAERALQKAENKAAAAHRARLAS